MGDMEMHSFVLEIEAPTIYTITPYLRYAKIKVLFGETELKLQQMWKGLDGSEQWRFVETVEL